MGERGRRRATGLLEWHGCLWRHHSGGGLARWRRLGRSGRGGRDNRVPSNTLSLSPCASFIRDERGGDNEGLWRHSSKRCMTVRVCFPHICGKIHCCRYMPEHRHMHMRKERRSKLGWGNEFRCVCTPSSIPQMCMCACMYERGSSALPYNSL